jgi:hypothetical protein
MRGGRYLVVLAGVGVLAAGCGTKVAPDVGLAAAVTRTAGQSARVAVTTTMQTPGMSVSFTETGAFDFARSRGMVSARYPAGSRRSSYRRRRTSRFPVALAGRCRAGNPGSLSIPGFPAGL